jgi:hypothetical protein
VRTSSSSMSTVAAYSASKTGKGRSPASQKPTADSLKKKAASISQGRLLIPRRNGYSRRKFTSIVAATVTGLPSL